MKRGITVLLSLCALVAVAYFTASKWAIRHEIIVFHDAAHNAPVEVGIAARRDKEMQANSGVIKLPVAIINSGGKGKFTEYSFIANALAAHGYLVLSVQHHPELLDAGEDPYERSVSTVLFAITEVQKIQPSADYRRLTLAGHAEGGDISLYFARLHPDRVWRLITLDNLKIPIESGKHEILSFRADGSDNGIVPIHSEEAKPAIRVVRLKAKHEDMTDRGPNTLKVEIESGINAFVERNTVNVDEGNPVERLINYMYEHSYVSIAVLLLTIVGVVVLLVRDSALASQFFASQNRRDYFARYFAQKAVLESALGGGMLLLAIVWSLVTKDTTSAFMSGALFVAVVIRFGLTHYRASKGYLGTNAAEAEELIGFIAKQHRDRDFPPNIRKLSPEQNKRPQDVMLGEMAKGQGR